MTKLLIGVVAAVALACLGLPVLLYAALTGAGPGACHPATTVDSPGTTEPTWTAEQLDIAATIVDVGITKTVPRWGWVVALATAMQESGLRNLPNLGDANDHDSIGVFQQRPSQGWGTPDQLADPAYQAGKFYDKLLTIPGWEQLPLTDAAQAVQRSANPDAYAKWTDQAIALVDTFANTAIDCTALTLGQLPADYTIPASTPLAVVTAITWALAQLGTPYSFGGTCTDPHAGNPATQCDCSSLVQQAYAAAGIHIPRVTGDQVNAGTAIASPDQLLPGDLILIPGALGTLTHPGHVGMYLGHGLIIHAPQTGDVVRITQLDGWLTDVAAIRRIASDRKLVTDVLDGGRRLSNPSRSSWHRWVDAGASKPCLNESPRARFFGVVCLNLRVSNKRRRHHHVVPRLHLRGFATPERALVQLDLRTGGRREISITDAAVIRDFYTIVLPNGTRSDAWEHWLGEVENEIAPTLKRAIRMPEFRLTEDERARLARWISLQYLRGPDNRRHMADIASFAVHAQVGMGGLAYLRHAMSQGLGREVSLAEAEIVWADITSAGGPRVEGSGDEHLQLLTRAYEPTTATVYSRSWRRIRFNRQTLAVSDSPVNLVPGDMPFEVGLSGARAITIPWIGARCCGWTGPAIEAQPRIETWSRPPFSRELTTLSLCSVQSDSCTSIRTTTRYLRMLRSLVPNHPESGSPAALTLQTETDRSPTFLLRSPL